MTRNSESIQSIRWLTPKTALRDGVCHVLYARRRWLGLGAILTGFAGAIPIAEAASFPPVFPLATLFPALGGDGSEGFVLTGIDTHDQSGTSVSAAGDVNGDGIDDVIVGARNARPAGRYGAGESYVVFGSTQGFPAVLPLASFFPGGGGDGSQGFVLTGIDASDESGGAVSGAGDLNGDGIDDLIVGARRADPGGNAAAGESYVVFGSSQGFPAVVPLVSLYPAAGGDGSRGFVLTGVDTYDFVGHAVSAAGDINGDGIDDLIIGAYDADPGGQIVAGETYVLFGSTLGFPAVLPLATLYPAGGGDGTRGFVLVGSELDRSGRSVSAAGDFNGDGIDDLIVGADGANPGGRTYAGESYVVFGSTQGFPAVLPLASLDAGGGGDGSAGFGLAGVDSGDRSGYSVSAAGDVNGDGIDDLIVGAYRATPGGVFGSGESYVVFGSTLGFPATLPLASLFPGGGGDGSQGFVLIGFRERSYSGRSVSAADDINGDGIDDLIIGAYGADAGRRDYAGESYVVFGSTQGFPAVLELETLYPARGGDGSVGFVFAGTDANDQSGRSVSAAGDVNGDGIDDIVIGAPLADPGGRSVAGESYVVFGRSAAH
jgi:hypothetical protein